ncbi:MAG: twin-arginine translocase subunit TatC [Candidatus Methanoperedens sp.]|nr:twin-arginine translocase subunit TatC [Candidatus Methanoperedens sp.]MCE8424843.1 twin-arginine translocase subunit TatC [Candidatus Methanoperedens sp.]MCE8427902.1 twin-arginine translocase subunit TatC [Candidatus Methanoperedens sp.]
MNSAPGDEELPLVEHVKELRTRMIIAAVPVALISAIAFFFSGWLLQAIWKQAVPVPMTIYSPMELIFTKLTLSLACALFLGIPLIIYEAFMFIGKGLYPNEKKFLVKIVLPSFILFAAGAIIAFFVAVPLIFKYSIFYSTDVALPQISVIKTIYTIIILVVGFGIVFQFPLLLLFSIKMGLVKAQDLRGKRKIIYGAFLAFALIISPDPSSISELLVAAMLVLLFEISLVMSRVF